MKKRIFIGLVLLVIILTGGGIIIDHNLDLQEKQAKYDAYAALLPLAKVNQDTPFFEAADRIRQFVFANTQFGEGEDFRKIWGDHIEIARRINQFVQGHDNAPPPLECSARSTVMESMLIALGYRVRSVSVYNYGPDYDSHRFLEVQNPKSGQWHAQDPQFNIFWRSIDTKERLGIRDLIAMPYSDYEPCITDQWCGWDLPNREDNYAIDVKEKFDLASVKDYQAGKRPLFVNTQRFKLKEPQMVDGSLQNYCDWIPKNCRDNIYKF